MMLPQHKFLKDKIEKLIDEKIEQLKEHLSFGSAMDHGAYLRTVGKIEGLRSALDACDEAERILERTF
jgi:hypothetical protein